MVWDVDWRNMDTQEDGGGRKLIRLNVAVIPRLPRHPHLGVPIANMGTNAREGAEVHSNLADAVLNEATLGVRFPAITYTSTRFHKPVFDQTHIHSDSYYFVVL